MLTQIKNYFTSPQSTINQETLTITRPSSKTIVLATSVAVGVYVLCLALATAGTDYSTSSTLFTELENFLPANPSHLIYTAFSSLLVTFAILCGVSMPLAANPIHSLMYLLALFVTMAIAYISVGQEYLAMVFLIVYIGAISILFLFVIMLIGVKFFGSAIPGSKRTERVVGAYCLVLITLGIYRALNVLPVPAPDGDMSHFVYVATLDVLHFAGMYTEHWSLFGMITIILLITMLGAIIVGTNGNDAVVVSRNTKVISAATPAVTAASEAATDTLSSSVSTDLSVYVLTGVNLVLAGVCLLTACLLFKQLVDWQRVLKVAAVFRTAFPWAQCKTIFFNTQLPLLFIVYFVCPFEILTAHAAPMEISEAVVAAEMTPAQTLTLGVEKLKSTDAAFYKQLTILATTDLDSRGLCRIEAEARALDRQLGGTWHEIRGLPNAKAAVGSIVDDCTYKREVLRTAILDYRTDNIAISHAVLTAFPELQSLMPVKVGWTKSDVVIFIVAVPFVALGVYEQWLRFGFYHDICLAIMSFWR